MNVDGTGTMEHRTNSVGVDIITNCLSAIGLFSHKINIWQSATVTVTLELGCLDTNEVADGT